MINQRIPAIRLLRNLTQSQLAAKLNKSDSVISRWETGATQIPASEIPNIIEALECTVNDLFTENIINGQQNNGNSQTVHQVYGDSEKWLTALRELSQTMLQVQVQAQENLKLLFEQTLNK